MRDTRRDLRADVRGLTAVVFVGGVVGATATFAFAACSDPSASTGRAKERAGQASSDGGASDPGAHSDSATTGAPADSPSERPTDVDPVPPGSYDPNDHRTESVSAGTVKLGWAQSDLGKAANYDNAGDANDPNKCPDPDEMVTPGTVDYKDGTWTLTGSGEGFIHGWDQGNLVYMKSKVTGDFTLTAKVDKFEMANGAKLNGAAEAILNVREDLDFKRPVRSVIAGAAPDKFIHMARYAWNENGTEKWWYWPAWPDTWPDSRPTLSWTRIQRRGNAFAAYSSADGVNWELIRHNDKNPAHPDWYPFRLEGMPDSVYVGLGCSARNDRNGAPFTKLSGKTADCRDPNSALLKSSARCVFSNLSLTFP